uniref:Uncharacterized protein n=1 Tax=Oryctolagus cuniculus TaxID=9986 RepID=A0A5F9D0S5_RABIT
MGRAFHVHAATHRSHQGLGTGPGLALTDFHPRSSLVFTARCLSSSAIVSSAICTCFSMSLTVSSEALSLDFFTLFIALVRTLLKESLALLVFCLASFTSISLQTHFGMGTRINVPSTSGFRFIPLSLIALIAAAQGPLTSGKLAIFTKISCGDFMEIWLIWFKASFPSAVTTVLILRVLLKLSLSASNTDFISSSTSSKLIISSTKAVLIFTLVWDCPFPLARKSTSTAAMVAIWGVNQRKEDLSVSLSLSVTLPVE